MSCCPPAPKIVLASDSPPLDGPEQTLRPGETAECFSQRAGNSTGALDDAIVARKNTIKNESVPVKCDASIDVQFALTSNSDPSDTPVYTLTNPIPHLVLSSDGHLTGSSWDANQLDTTIQISVNVSFTSTSDGAATDSRTYKFSPSVCKGGDSIKLLMPLLGDVQIKSPYGMRVHPIQKVEKFHTGIDIVKTVKGVHGDVIAAADGTVIKAKNTDPNGYGNAIHIQHKNSSGGVLCTTTYNHLYQMLVKEGDRVTAGQKIALEGGIKGDPGSGGSTGLHLHFECKLPNGAFTDPVPYLSTAVSVANAQTSTGEPDPSAGTTTVPPSGAAVTSAGVAAATSCPDTAGYPTDPTAPEPAAETPPASPPTNDPFELAWHFTMTYEVGPNWPVAAGSAPTDPDIVAGSIGTDDQKKKVGYKNWAKESGGETKFGIAKSGNPATDITGIAYDPAKALGFSNYWKRGKPIVPATIASTQHAPHLAIFMFDTNYQHGSGNGATIWNDSVQQTTPFTDKASQMGALDALYARRLAFANSLKVVANRAGVARRVTDCYNYVKGLPELS